MSADRSLQSSFSHASPASNSSSDWDLYGDNQRLSSLKNEQAEKNRLDKSNLELKMKAVFLEEKMKKLSGMEIQSNGINSGSVDFSKNGNYLSNDGGVLTMDNKASLRLIIEEKDIIIEQKNSLLIKAKQVISQLESELDRLRLIEDTKSGLEERLQKLKSANDDIEIEYRHQISELEAQLSMARQAAQSKEELRSSMTDKLARVEISNSELHEKYMVVREELTRENERNSNLQQRSMDMEYELSQLRARCDIYEMQVCELAGELDKERTNKGTLRQQLEDLQQQRNLDIESIKDNYGKIMEDLKASYIKVGVEKSALEFKCRDYDEIFSKYTSLKERSEYLIREHDDLKSEVKTKSELIDSLRQQSCEAVHLGELCTELREMLRNEQSEKNNSITRAEQLSMALESAKTAMKEQNTTLSFADDEVKRLSVDNIELNKKVNLIADISRENERLKSTIMSQSRDLSELNERLKDTQDSLTSCRQDLIKKSDIVASLQLENRELKSQMESQQKQVETQSSNLSSLQSLVTSLRLELDGEHSQRSINDENMGKLVEFHSQLANGCILACCSIENWDSILENALDGDFFSPILNTIASSSLQKNVTVNNKSEDDLGGSNIFRISSAQNMDWKNIILECSSNTSTSKRSSDLFLKHVTSLIESVHQKMKRVSKIRALFNLQSQKMSDLVLKQVDSALQRVSLVTLEVGEAHKKLDSIGNIVMRDKKLKDDDLADMKNFREEIIVDFSKRLRETELKLASALKTTEDEVLARTKMEEERNQIFGKINEEQGRVSDLQTELARLKLELSRYENYDTVVSEITARFNEITENNRVLRSEAEFKNEQIRELQLMNKDLNVERGSAQVAIDVLKQKLQQTEEKLRDNLRLAQTQSKDIAYLQARQIDPLLLQNIQKTQLILQQGGHPSSVVSNNGIGNEFGYASEDNQKHLRSIAEIAPSVDELIKKSQEIVKQFECYCDNVFKHGSENNPSPNLYEIRGEIQDLLDDNSRLVTFLNQVVFEFRRLFQKQEKDGTLLQVAPSVKHQQYNFEAQFSSNTSEPQVSNTDSKNMKLDTIKSDDQLNVDSVLCNDNTRTVSSVVNLKRISSPKSGSKFDSESSDKEVDAGAISPNRSDYNSSSSSYSAPITNIPINSIRVNNDLTSQLIANTAYSNSPSSTSSFSRPHENSHFDPSNNQYFHANALSLSQLRSSVSSQSPGYSNNNNHKYLAYSKHPNNPHSSTNEHSHNKKSVLSSFVQRHMNASNETNTIGRVARSADRFGTDLSDIARQLDAFGASR